MARKPNIQELRDAHRHATEEAIRLAREGLELSQAGKLDEARAAERRAKIWHDRVKALQAKLRKAKP
jgi:hypothetical protein